MMKELRQVPFGRSTIDYRVERSDRRKTVTVAVDPSVGVVLRAPWGVSTRRLDEVVKAKAPWILERLVGFRELGSVPPPKEFVAGESYSYLGRSYRLRILCSAGVCAPAASLYGGFLTVRLPCGDLRQEREMLVRGALVAWYRRQAERRLAERVELYAERAGVRRPIVLVREQDKRWGSCNSKGMLRFNWRVMMAPLSLVDYVVAHEVCHVAVRDHSRTFWKLLETVLPDYEERRSRLRVAGARYHFDGQREAGDRWH